MSYSKTIIDAGFLVPTGELTNTYSVDFDGTNDYCGLGFKINVGSAYTYSAWVKTTDTTATVFGDINSSGWTTTTRGHLGWRDDFWYFSIGDGTESGYDYRNSLDDASSVLDGDWHHVALTIDGYDHTIYVDGSEDASWSSTIEAGTAGTIDLTIGSWGGYYHFLDGKIDEAAIFSSALDSTAIESLYNSGSPADLSGDSPYAWYRMGDSDGGSGTTITDEGSGGQDGTLVNSPTFSTDAP